MKFSALLLAICLLQVISTEAQSHAKKNAEKKQKRQTNASADKMVQNILQWLQGLYDSQNTRIVRQGSFLEYLPPANTNKPRPFGYPEAGVTPFPPFPGPGDEYPSSPGVFPNEVLPPEPGTGQPGGSTTFPQFPTRVPGGQPGPTTTFFPGGPSIPGRGDIPSEGGLPPFPTFPSGEPSTFQPGGYPSQQPGGFSTQTPTGYPSYQTTGTPFSEQPLVSGGQGTTVQQPGGFSTFQPTSTPFQGQSGVDGQGSTGYPSGIPTSIQPGGGPSFPPPSGGSPTSQPTETPSFLGQPGVSDQGISGGYPTFQPTGTPGQPGVGSQLTTGYSNVELSTQQPEGGYSYQPPFPQQPGVEGQGTTGLSNLPAGEQGTTSLTEQPSPGSPAITGYPTQPPFGQPTTGSPEQHAVTEVPKEEGPKGDQSTQPTVVEQPTEGSPSQTPVEGGEPSAAPIPQPTSGVTSQQPEGTTAAPGYQPGPEVSLTTSQSSVVPEGVSEGTPAPEPARPSQGSTVEPGIPGQTTSSTDLGAPVPGSPENPTLRPEETEEPHVPGSGFTPSIPRGFTTSPSSVTREPESIPAVTFPAAEAIPEGSEDSQTTISPESNTIPQVGPQEPVEVEDDKHPPHIHAIDVECGKEMMTINIEFNKEFNGIIYSKGYFNMPECRYVQENSGQIKYSFTVNLNMCGTEFVNAFETEGQSYLENILVLQNEVGIQEQWDTVRAVRCLWEGNIKDTLSVAFSIGMLSQEIITFSGDTAMAKLDVVLGKGPFGSPANGLVKIGENMTLVVSVTGDPGFDVQVKDCKAIDSTGGNSVQLTDENGCILKPKLFGAFQKTRDTGNTGASVIAFAHFNAFKFPDIMDLMIECNIELCKTDCDICKNEGESLDPILRRKRRDTANNNTLGEGVMMGKHLRIVLPNDLENIPQKLEVINNVCISLQNFVFSSAILISLLVITSLTSCYLWLRKERNERYFKQ